jgi:hypothetical protein
MTNQVIASKSGLSASDPVAGVRSPAKRNGRKWAVSGKAASGFGTSIAAATPFRKTSPEVSFDTLLNSILIILTD